MVAFECRLAAHLHVDSMRVRRAPLPLVLLWLNHAVQADGMETWWLDGEAVRKSAARVGVELAELREAAAAWDDCTGEG